MKRFVLFLMLVAGTAMAADPAMYYNVDFNDRDGQAFHVKTRYRNTPVIIMDLYENDSAWSATGFTVSFRYAKNIGDATNGMGTIVGAVSSNRVTFTSTTNSFMETYSDGYAAVVASKNDTIVSYAVGKLTVSRAPEIGAAIEVYSGVSNTFSVVESDTLATVLARGSNANNEVIFNYGTPSADDHVIDRGYADGRYLEETGDTFAGSSVTYQHADDDGYLTLRGSSGITKGGSVEMYGQDYSNGGDLILRASTSNAASIFLNHGYVQGIEMTRTNVLMFLPVYLHGTQTVANIVLSSNEIENVIQASETDFLGQYNTFTTSNKFSDQLILDGLTLDGSEIAGTGNGLTLLGNDAGTALTTGRLLLDASGNVYFSVSTNASDTFYIGRGSQVVAGNRYIELGDGTLEFNKPATFDSQVRVYDLLIDGNTNFTQTTTIESLTNILYIAGDSGKTSADGKTSTLWMYENGPVYLMADDDSDLTLGCGIPGTVADQFIVLDQSDDEIEMNKIIRTVGIVPFTSNAYNLGSAAMPWKDLYLSGESIYFDTSRLHLTNDVLTFTGTNSTAARIILAGDDLSLLANDNYGYLTNEAAWEAGSNSVWASIAANSTTGATHTTSIASLFTTQAVVNATATNAVPKAGGTMTGKLTMNVAGTTALALNGATTAQALLTGSGSTALIVLSSTGTLATATAGITIGQTGLGSTIGGVHTYHTNNATPYKAGRMVLELDDTSGNGMSFVIEDDGADDFRWYDDAGNMFLKLDQSGTLWAQGDWNMGQNIITNYGLPTADGHVIDKGYADATYLSSTNNDLIIATNIYVNGVETEANLVLGSNAVQLVVSAGGGVDANDSVGWSTNNALQTVNMNANWLSGDGDAEGLFVAADGKVGAGTATPSAGLDIVVSSGDALEITSSSQDSYAIDILTGYINFNSPNWFQIYGNNPNAWPQVGIGLGSLYSGYNFLFCNSAFRTTWKNYDHTASENPTVFIHSNTNPDISNNEWGSVTHDQTNMVFRTGAATGAGSAPSTIPNHIIFDPTGSVGVGTASPSTTLDVAGTFQVSDLLCEADFPDGASQDFVSTGYTHITNYVVNVCDSGYSATDSNVTVSAAGRYRLYFNVSYNAGEASMADFHTYTNGGLAYTTSGNILGTEEETSVARTHGIATFEKTMVLPAGCIVDFRVQTVASETFTWEHGTVGIERK